MALSRRPAVEAVQNRLARAAQRARHRRSVHAVARPVHPHLPISDGRSALRRQCADSRRGAVRAELLGDPAEQAALHHRAAAAPRPAAIDRRDESTREMRRLIGASFGRDALRWFDEASEPFRGFANGGGKLDYGAFFGSSYDRDGLYASKVYYELPGGRGQIDNLPLAPARHRPGGAAVRVPGLRPLFTTLAAQRDMGGQRLTFACTRAAPARRPADRARRARPGPPAARRSCRSSASSSAAASTCRQRRAAGVRGGGRRARVRDLRAARRHSRRAAELPQPAHPGPRRAAARAAALERWMAAFTPEDDVWPGRFSIVSVRTDRASPPRVSLYLRPVEFELPAEAHARRPPDRRARTARRGSS